MSDISATRGRIHTKFYFCRDNVCRRAPSPSGVHRPLGGRREEELKTKNGGWSHSCIGQLPFLFFSALPNVVQYVGHRPAHILVKNRQDRPRRLYRVGQKVRKKFEFFTISRINVHISQKLLKIEAYKQVRKKAFISPLSSCRMYMDPSLTGFYRVSQKVSDIIPVLRLTPIATQPSAVSVF